MLTAPTMLMGVLKAVLIPMVLIITFGNTLLLYVGVYLPQVFTGPLYTHDAGYI